MANYVEGLPQLKAAMMAVPAKVMKQAVRKAVREAGNIVVKEAKARAPRRPGSGVLRRNITKKMTKVRNNRITVLVGVESGKVQLNEGGTHVTFKSHGKTKMRRATRRERRGEDPYYYRFQEVGFTAVGTRRGGGGRWIEGKKYLSGSLDDKATLIVRQFEVLVTASLEKFKAS